VTETQSTLQLAVAIGKADTAVQVRGDAARMKGGQYFGAGEVGEIAGAIAFQSGFQHLVFLLAQAKYHQAVSSVAAHSLKPCSSSQEKAGHVRVRRALDGTYHLVVDFYGHGTLQGFHPHYDLEIVVFPQQEALQPS
jgi:hypothetical protein